MIGKIQAKVKRQQGNQKGYSKKNLWHHELLEIEKKMSLQLVRDFQKILFSHWKRNTILLHCGPVAPEEPLITLLHGPNQDPKICFVTNIFLHKTVSKWSNKMRSYNRFLLIVCHGVHDRVLLLAVDLHHVGTKVPAGLNKLSVQSLNDGRSNQFGDKICLAQSGPCCNPNQYSRGLHP